MMISLLANGTIECCTLYFALSHIMPNINKPCRYIATYSQLFLQAVEVHFNCLKVYNQKKMLYRMDATCLLLIHSTCIAVHKLEERKVPGTNVATSLPKKKKKKLQPSNTPIPP